ncbi:hypothetical protein Q4555_11175 [Octadecabacter sp. 1_MG-2023]|uniref:hypothetical protein n=1 Tax=unclassified Octadecabacter TaxID=196158 RepID=UPI001C0A312D|nr:MULTISPECIES: hypothetical protein [unclassified Octadecabacter]MBU2993924.1 hypothetical protein [Octadecabacter sp. B2R22]MDO6735230.1 hypothetical protein [Octadecabacter sp. 1_MG-2023]
MTDPGSQVTTREERLLLGRTVIDDCVRSECGRLNLDSQLVEDYTPVAQMSHVTALMTSYTNFSNLSDIAAMSQLKELHIGVTQVSDLSGLSNFPNLRLLHAQGLSVDDFSPIGQLRHLEELAIGANFVGDLSFVQELRSLKDLNLDGADVTSLAGLRNHPSIERLDFVDATLPDDFSVLRSLPKLRQISVSEWPLNEDQKLVIDALRDTGVEVLVEALMIVC